MGQSILGLRNGKTNPMRTSCSCRCLTFKVAGAIGLFTLRVGMFVVVQTPPSVHYRLSQAIAGGLRDLTKVQSVRTRTQIHWHWQLRRWSIGRVSGLSRVMGRIKASAFEFLWRSCVSRWLVFGDARGSGWGFYLHCLVLFQYWSQ